MVKIPIKTARNHDQEPDIPIEEQTPPVDERPDAAAPAGEAADVVTGPADAFPQAESLPEASDGQETPASETDAAETDEGEGRVTLEAVEDLDDVTRLTRQLRAKEQDATEHYDARLRLQAEFDNFKKRKEKELADFRQYANSSLLEEIMGVLDDFERAIAAAEQTRKLEDFLQGIEMILNKFLDTLRKKGVREVEAAPGQVFDPVMHEAVTQIATDEIAEGAIAAVFQKGYYLHDRILRAPKVGVAKPKD